jgi:L-lactate dehydrogenase
MENISIGIIGTGWVGASVAISVLQKGICNELLLNDINMDIAEGEAMDLNHGSPFFPSATVRAVSIEEMVHCQAIVVTAGRGGEPDESRLELLNDNIRIAKTISSKLKDFEGVLVVVANPVDVLTYFYKKFNDLPARRVIGTGTMLETARLRDMVGKKLKIDPRSVHAQVVGEHGDSKVILWSRAQVGGMSIRKWPTWKPEFEEEIAHEVRTAAYEIIRRKGSTNHAVGLVSAALLEWLVRGERRIVNVATFLTGQYGLSDVAISLPSLVTQKGITDIVEIEMEEDERERFLASAEIIRKAIRSVE